MGRAILIVLGSLAALVALGLLAAGGVAIWAHETQRDAEGYYTTDAYRYTSDSYAIASEDVDVSEGPDWVFSDVLGSLRIRATGAERTTPLFIGVGPAAAVRDYLAGVDHDDIESVQWPLDVDYVRVPGGSPPGLPGEQQFWDAAVSGTGEQELVWDVDRGDWTVVAMNADGSAGVALDATVGAKVGFVLPLGIVLAAVGAAVLAVGALLIGLGARARPRALAAAPGAGEPTAAPAGPPTPAAPTVYPVALTGELEAPSRWLWLVKWILAIPHWLVLAFLWIGFVGATIAAFVSILVTGRYPRGLFDFNVGVLRWTWRVAFYSYSALGTDRYPPFALGSDPAYPADLHVVYPERLSRGLVLVKWWLLALPHLVIVAVLNSGVGVGHNWGVGGGVIGLLVLVVGIVLLFAGRYPRELFDVVMGLNRWTYRVVAYVALMRDEYPPFRLDPGPHEPEQPGPADPLGAAVPDTP